MSPRDERETLQRLGDAMSDLQQACFCATWMCVTPTIEALCRAAIKTGEPQPWGGGELSVSAARHMWTMAERLGGWAEPDWDSDADNYVIAHPFCPLDSDGLEGFYRRQSSDV
jgi:hypothetical protein